MKNIIIFSQHFAPAFKGGGPIQSLVNLSEILKKEFRVFIYCSARDLNEKNPMISVKCDKWNIYSEGINVYYSNAKIPWPTKVLQESGPGLVYINGIFSIHYNLIPLLFAKSQRRGIIIAPRGMLQQGALLIRPFKKRLFLYTLKILGVLKNVTWHATDDQEAMDIKKVIGSRASVKIASNIPKSIPTSISLKEKTGGNLKLIYLSLIAEKKNLRVVLEALAFVKMPIEFDIYGPVKDEAYWRECKELMQNQIHNIRYMGLLNPQAVQQTLTAYHAFILPTKGENFGHAIYESLSVGTPVLISRFTPWKHVQDVRAGITVESFEPEDWANAIQTFIDFDNHEYAVYAIGAVQLARSYFLKNDFKAQYQNLFS